MIASPFLLLSFHIINVVLCLSTFAWVRNENKVAVGTQLACKLPIRPQRRRNRLRHRLGYICLCLLQFRVVPVINNHLANFPQSTLPCSREDEMGPEHLNTEEALQQPSFLSGQGYPHTSCRWCLGTH